MSKEKKIEKKEKNYFEILSDINVSDKVEKKNGLSYLSWAWAWSEIKKRYPNVKKNIVKNESGWLYHTDGKTCWVEVSVTINDVEETEYLPVMDYRNQSIKLDNITSMNVNTTIQRALTKAIARHGLGLYVYAGEDLPEDAKSPQQKANEGNFDDWGNTEEGKKWCEENFKTVKKAIESCNNPEELKESWKKSSVTIARLKKYDKERYELIIDAKDGMKLMFEAESEEPNGSLVDDKILEYAQGD